VGITFQPPRSGGGIDLGVTVYPKYRLVVMVVTAALVLGCYLFATCPLRRGHRAGSKTGTRRPLGINIRQVFTLTFAAGPGWRAWAAAWCRSRHSCPRWDRHPARLRGGGAGRAGQSAGAIRQAARGVVQSLMTAIWAPGADISVFALMTLGIIARPRASSAAELRRAWSDGPRSPRRHRRAAALVRPVVASRSGSSPSPPWPST
jgi:branched-chain amino acid transport system permease protein